MTVGDKIKEIRLSNNMSQERFGRKIGVSGKSISTYERGKSDPPLKLLDSIAYEYGTALLHVNGNAKSNLYLHLNSIKKSLLEIETILIDKGE